MRPLIAALALAATLAGCATAPPAPSAGGWSFDYDAAQSLAIATQREPGGAVTATFTCRAPSGDLTITDYTLPSASRATVTVGGFEMQAPARGETVDGRAALVVPLPQSPPALAAVREGVSMMVSAGGRRHALAAGAARHFQLVAQSCWPTGS